MRLNPGNGLPREARTAVADPGTQVNHRGGHPLPRPAAAAVPGRLRPPLPPCGPSPEAARKPVPRKTRPSAPPAAPPVRDCPEIVIGSEGLRRAVSAFFLLAEEEKASYLALIAGGLPNHAGALYSGFDALDKRQKAIFVSLMANSRDVGMLLRSGTGRLLIDCLMRDQAETILSSVQAMDSFQKKRLLSLLGAAPAGCALPPLAGSHPRQAGASRGEC